MTFSLSGTKLPAAFRVLALSGALGLTGCCTTSLPPLPPEAALCADYRATLIGNCQALGAVGDIGLAKASVVVGGVSYRELSDTLKNNALARYDLCVSLHTGKIDQAEYTSAIIGLSSPELWVEAKHPEIYQMLRKNGYTPPQESMQALLLADKDIAESVKQVTQVQNVFNATFRAVTNTYQAARTPEPLIERRLTNIDQEISKLSKLPDQIQELSNETQAVKRIAQDLNKSPTGLRKVGVAHFDPGRDDRLSEEDKTLLSKLLAGLSLQKMKFSIVGYADRTGSEAANRRISQRRAETLARWLVIQHGVAPAQLFYIGVGALHSPDLTGDRRAELFVSD